MLSFFIVTAFCANSLAVLASDVVIAPQHKPIAIEKSDIRDELTAPVPSSVSNYFQPQLSLHLPQQQQQSPQTLGQLLGIQQAQQVQQQYTHPILQQQSPINPFLYLGQLMLSDPGAYLLPQQRQRHILPTKTRSEERSIQNQESDSYALYRPNAEDSVEFVDMLPPDEEQEPNYYVIKPRKFKKFVESDEKEKKVNSQKPIIELKQRIKIDENESKDVPNYDLLTESSDVVEKSAPTSRLDFQMHGHKGPKSYKFGYDTGAGKNRQFRVEERDEKGDVYGKYGYYDRKGKFVTVSYSSTAKGGFKIL